MPQHEVVIDPTQVKWAVSMGDMPDKAVFAAGVCFPKQEIKVIDLLYSKMVTDFWKEERERLLDIMDTTIRTAPEHLAAQHDLIRINKNGLPYDVYGGIIPGKYEDNDVVGLILFYRKEEDNG